MITQSAPLHLVIDCPENPTPEPGPTAHPHHPDTAPLAAPAHYPPAASASSLVALLGEASRTGETATAAGVPVRHDGSALADRPYGIGPCGGGLSAREALEILELLHGRPQLRLVRGGR